MLQSQNRQDMPYNQASMRGQYQRQGQPQGQGQRQIQGQSQGQRQARGQSLGQNQARGQNLDQSQSQAQGQGQSQAQAQGQRQVQGQSQSQAQSQSLGQSANRPSAPVFHVADMLYKRLIAAAVDVGIIGTAATAIMPILWFILPTIIAQALCFMVNLLSIAVVLLKDKPFKLNLPFNLGELDGQTIGKRLMNIHVTTLQNTPITAEQSIKRNLVLALPFVCYGVSMVIWFINVPLFMALSLELLMGVLCAAAILFEVYRIHAGTQNRRFGDMLAGTIVSWS